MINSPWVEKYNHYLAASKTQYPGIDEHKRRLDIRHIVVDEMQCQYPLRTKEECQDLLNDLIMEHIRVA